jgi:signal transduction histidine kinase
MLRLILRRLSSRIRNKIILPYLLLALCLAITMTFVAVRLTTGAVQERLNNRLVEAGQATSDGLVAVEDQQIEQLRGMAFTRGVADALAESDAARLDALLRPYWSSLGLSTLVAFDTAGKPLLAWQRNPGDPVGGSPRRADLPDLQAWWLVQQIVGGRSDAYGDKFSAFHDRHFYTVAPVRRGSALVGGLMVGLPTDALLERLQSRSQASVSTFYDGSGRAFATTQILVSGEVVPAVPAAVLDGLRGSRAAGPGKHLQDVATLNGRDYQVAYSPLRVRRTLDGFFAVALPRELVVDTWAQQRLPLMGLALAMVGAVIGVGLALSQHITRPLHELVATARAVAKGELRQRSQVESRDELGVVSNAFNQMTERLLHLYETSRALSSQTEIEDILTQVTLALRSLAPGVQVLALLEERHGWRCYLSPAAPAALQPLHRRRVAGQALPPAGPTARHPQLVQLGDPRLSFLELLAEPAEVYCVALNVQEREIGQLLVLADRHGLLPEALMEPVAAVASMAATALHNGLLILEIQAEGNRRRAILESIADGVLVCDAEGYVVLMNPAAEQLLQVPDWAARRYRFQDLPLTPLETPLLTGERVPLPRYEAHGLVLQANSAILSAQDAALSGEVIVLHNISEEVALDRAKTSLIALISHELRTPLTTISGATDMLCKGVIGPLSEAQLELAEMALRQSRAMNALIDKAILVANLESGTVQFESRLIELRSVVETALEPLRSQARAAKVTLLTEIPPDLPQLQADPRMLGIAIQQLVENAISYAGAAPLRLVARRYQGGVALAVRDYGPGIPSEALPQLFHRLSRRDQSLNEAPRGLGLGLVITRELIERQGGAIDVESQPGQGTLFTILLPGASDEHKAAA